MNEKPDWTGLFKIGAISALLIVLVYFVELVIILLFGLPPNNAEEWLILLQKNKLVGLIQTLAPDIIAVACHAPVFIALFYFLRQTKKGYISLVLAVVFALIGMAVYFATNITFSMLYLSDQFASATTEAQKSQILNSAQTLLAVYNGTGPFVAFFLYAVAGILISVVMLQSHLFSRGVAIAGIVGNALELGLPPSVDPAFFLQIDPYLIGIGGVILIFWYIAIAVKLYRVSL